MANLILPWKLNKGNKEIGSHLTYWFFSVDCYLTKKNPLNIKEHLFLFLNLFDTRNFVLISYELRMFWIDFRSIECRMSRCMKLRWANFNILHLAAAFSHYKINLKECYSDKSSQTNHEYVAVFAANKM